MITLTPYNPEWPKLFIQEKAKLHRVLDDIAVDIVHIGSTAIPGIQAKPVIDIMIGVENLNKFGPTHIQQIESLDYEYIQFYEENMPHRRFFQKQDAQGKRTHNIHLVNYDSAWWRRHIVFRDFLRAHPEEAEAYETYKFTLAEALNAIWAGDKAPDNFFRQQLRAHPKLAQEYQRMVAKYGDQFTITNRYALMKSALVDVMHHKAYFDFTLHKPDVVLNRLIGYVPQQSCFAIYKEMFQNPDFVRCFGIKLSDERIQQILERDVNYWDQYGFGPYVWFDKTTHEFVGEGGLNHIIIEEREEIELTYSLVNQFWGRGLAVEIGRFAIDYGFNQLKLDHIVCVTMTTNQQSLRVMQKLDFAYEKDFTHYNLPHQLYQLKNSAA